MMDESSKLCGPGISDYHHQNCNVTRFTKVCDKTDTLCSCRFELQIKHRLVRWLNAILDGTRLRGRGQATIDCSDKFGDIVNFAFEIDATLWVDVRMILIQLRCWAHDQGSNATPDRGQHPRRDFSSRNQPAFELFQHQLEPYQRKSNARKLVD
jgi:hypothetical protein